MLFGSHLRNKRNEGNRWVGFAHLSFFGNDCYALAKQVDLTMDEGF